MTYIENVRLIQADASKAWRHFEADHTPFGHEIKDLLHHERKVAGGGAQGPLLFILKLKLLEEPQ